MADDPTPIAQSSGICRLPCELLCQIVHYLEPRPEVNLNKAFRPLMNGPLDTPWTSTSRPQIDTSSPSIDDLRSEAQPIWDAYRDRTNLAATCNHIHALTSDAPYRVVILFTGKQLARFFLAILREPHRKQHVQTLQLHQFLFMRPQEKALMDELASIKQSAGWHVLTIAYRILFAAKYVRMEQVSPNVIMSQALLHLLPKVSALYMPYPRSLLTSRYHAVSFRSNRVREPEITVAQKLRPKGTPSQTLALHEMQSGRLKHLQLNAIVHFQTFQYQGHGHRISKAPNPVPYWIILGLSDVFKTLESLDLQRIGDPLLPLSLPTTLHLPCVKELKLHSLNINEADLLRMLPAVPALETLEVWFTMNRRWETVSETQQKLLDDNLENFPRNLKNLTLAYLCDPVYPSGLPPSATWPAHLPPFILHMVASQPWKTTLKPRHRFANLHKLKNLESVAIDISSLVSSPPDPDNRLAALPPKLKHLRLFSVTSITPAELQKLPPNTELPCDREPIEWEYMTYLHLLSQLKAGLYDCFAGVEDRRLQHIELVRPLFLDEVVHKAKTDKATRDLQGWSDRMIDIAHKYETGVPREMQLSAQWLRDYCGFDVSLLLDFKDQMGGDKVTQRNVEVFWGRGH